jgi:hypothetical protein
MMREIAIRRLPIVAALWMSVALSPGVADAGAPFEIVNLDSPAVGFSDTSPWSPAGGNPATTLGEARLKALEFALSIWSETLDSPVVIRVGAKFEAMGGTGEEHTLGKGGAARWSRDFVGAPLTSTLYPAALADKLAGVDLAPGEVDINLKFNLDVDGPVVMGEAGFDYGLSIAPQGEDASFVLVALHEVAHGLGVALTTDSVTGAKQGGADDPYLLRLVRSGASPEGLAQMTDAERLAALVSGSELQWEGPAVAAASAALTAGTASGGRVLMYAPAVYDPLSNGVHFAPELSPDQIQEPIYEEHVLNLALTRALLEDLGWGPAPGCEPIASP